MMTEIGLSVAQQAIMAQPLTHKIYLDGAAGTGKTTTGVERLRHLLANGVPAASIIVLVPQRTLGSPYLIALRDPALPPGGEVRIATLGSIGRELVDLFWVLAAEEAGFANPTQRPTFLSLETAQYYMARVITPLVAQTGAFETVTIDRNRLYSQILDNLNKAAVVGFPYTEIGERLRTSTINDEAQRRTYADVQQGAALFRDYCLAHNLVDFSLQTELLMRILWHIPPARRYFTARHTHLIVDNLEEESPAMHDLLLDWVAECQSALLIYDTDAGYRRFLGADDISAQRLRTVCDVQEGLTDTWVTSPELTIFSAEIGVSLGRQLLLEPSEIDPRMALVFEDHRYHTQMLDWTAEQISTLVNHDGVQPGEIVVIAPFLSDALRFALMNRLEANSIPARSHRPSRSLREEPAAQCLLTLAYLAHPSWTPRPTTFDVGLALMTAIDGLDLVRAGLLAQIVYRPKETGLAAFEQIKGETQERITFRLGGRYDVLRQWLLTYAEGEAQPLDHFWTRLFGEVLSQAGYGLHDDFGGAEIAANLIDSARKFRQTILVPPTDKLLAQEFVEMVQSGILADQYLRSWQPVEQHDAVLIAPAYTFLMRNTPVDIQFWLNVGGQGWAERVYQPLTHPYVLTRNWQPGRVWTDVDEVETSTEALYRLVTGLTRRCRRQVYLGFSQLGEQGNEQHGVLLDAIQRMLRRYATGAEVSNV
ncbi:MAG: hypothetical protein H7Y11_02655 [Armatimonadetes bacterium]|nr:hypothetical protein [Anaerolineae bacterium]